MDKVRAQEILAKIDEILRWEQRVDQQKDQKFAELGKYLCEVRDHGFWRLGYPSFEALLEKKFPDSRRKAYYLMSIHEHLPKPIRRELKQVGWAKAVELVKVARRDRERFESATWLHKARSLPKQEFKAEVERELTGRDTEPSELMYFKVYKIQMPVIEQALDTAALMLGSDRSRGYCLEMICADFLAGAHVENADPKILLFSMLRLFRFLPAAERASFLREVTHAA